MGEIIDKGRPKRGRDQNYNKKLSYEYSIVILAMDGRFSLLIGWLKLYPKVRRTMEGRWSMGWLKHAPMVKWMIEGGKLLMGLLTIEPKVKWETEDGRELTSWSKFCPRVRWMMEEGRELIGWLKLAKFKRLERLGEVINLLIEFGPKTKINKRMRKNKVIDWLHGLVSRS